MNVKKVVVHGSYFVNNFGDTLLIKLLSDRISRYIGIENVRLAMDGLSKEQLSIGYPVIQEHEIDNVTDVFFSGGGYFGEPNVGFFEKQRWVYRNYKRHFAWNYRFKRSKFHIIGVGVGPITSRVYRFLVGRFLKQCQSVLVRDKESFDYCSSYFALNKCDICVDLALSTQNLKLEKRGISIHLDTAKPEIVDSIIFYLKDKFNHFDDSSLKIIFDNDISYNEENLEIYKASLKKHGYSSSEFEFVKYQNVDQLINVLSSSSLVITSKLHVGIVTISQGGKVIAVPKHSKTRRLYSQLSLSDYCIESYLFDIDKFDASYRKLDGFAPDKAVIERGINLIEDQLEMIFSK